ncbi:MAG: SDR family NAD(P)-dependent oxidoreductase, partial [Dehalococcoidales bacterium]|nr:SDR family NAD(P)-dependent oxidoreductase [Dehalococcoidales bacterium]
MDKRFSLEGKVAIVSGASRGIGKAAALALADAGATVVVASRKLEDLEKVAAEIKAKGVKSLAVAAHVAKLEESKNLVDQTVKQFKKIDILFNNAGTNPYAGTLMDAEEWAWDTTFNVNLKGPFFLGQQCARVMRDNGGGCQINTASVAGLIPAEIAI